MIWIHRYDLETLDPSEFELGDVYEDILLESFLQAGSIRIRAAELFPTDWRVNFPKALREENPVGTQFRAEIAVSASTTDPDTLFLKALSKTIEIVT